MARGFHGKGLLFSLYSKMSMSNTTKRDQGEPPEKSKSRPDDALESTNSNPLREFSERSVEQNPEMFI
jgi:hypothetical protein